MDDVMDKRMNGISYRIQGVLTYNQTIVAITSEKFGLPLKKSV